MPNATHPTDKRRELNRSFGETMAEMQSLCQEISIWSSKRFAENGTGMEDPKVCPQWLGPLKIAYLTHGARLKKKVSRMLQVYPTTATTAVNYRASAIHIDGHGECIPAPQDKIKPASEASPAAG